MIFKRCSILIMVLAISYFSHTPYIKVTNPDSWTNNSMWNHTETLWSILRFGSPFYTSYNYGFDLEFILRKIAHISFFGLLALLIYWNLKKNSWRYVKAWFLLTCFAFLDELHQAFIIGRDGRIIDVAIDSFGGALFLFLLYRYKKISRN
ncbi:MULTISPECIES: VanZ family protein [Priestia]|uniref:VanZ family protein n=1 Tax=Priestia TaxID=2800373 RepID=UPI001CB9B223|nr:VanZ family protein [Priestia megaterium]